MYIYTVERLTIRCQNGSLTFRNRASRAPSSVVHDIPCIYDLKVISYYIDSIYYDLLHVPFFLMNDVHVSNSVSCKWNIV